MEINKWSSEKKVEFCTYYCDGRLKSFTDVSSMTVCYEYDGDRRLQYLKENIDDTGYKTAKDAGSVKKNVDDEGRSDSILTEYRYTNPKVV